MADRDRDPDLRPRNARPRDALGRPLPRGADGVERQPEGVVRTPDQTLAEARALLAEGKPFHAHEVFEDAWKNAPADEQELWRGLAQLAVGITHAARGNRAGAVSLLDRGAKSIAAYDGLHGDGLHGVDVPAVQAWVRDSIAAVEAACPVVLQPPPV